MHRLTHPKTVFDVAFISDRVHILTTDGVPRLWRVADGAAEGSLESVGFVSRVAGSPSGAFVAAVADNEATIFDLSGRQRLYTVRARENGARWKRDAPGVHSRWEVRADRN